MYHAVIFTGIEIGPSVYYRALGAYRIRTELESKGYNVKVIDHFSYLTEDNIEHAFRKYVSKETIWVGFSTTFFDCNNTLDLRNDFFSDLKNRYNVPIVMGGAKSLLGKFNFADYLITGHADSSIVALTEFLSGKSLDLNFREILGKKVIESNITYDKKDLSNVPVVWKKEDLIKNTFTMPIEIARGCIFNCSFCNYPLNNKSKFDYIREKTSIRDEFIKNYEEFGLVNYQFMDDTYNDSMVKMELMHNVITSLPFKIKFDAYIKPELLVRWPEQIALLNETGLRGASFGVESFHSKARSAIQKMPDIDKILDSISSIKYQSNGSVKVQMNLIVGLPYEDEASLLRTQDIVRKSDYIDFWNWWPLQIHDKNNFEYHSPIDKNPKSFGYDVSIPVHTNFKNLVVTDTVYWKNENMDVFEATAITQRLSKEDAPFKKLGGWFCGAVSSVGVDIDAHFKNKNGLIDSLPFDTMKVTKSNIIKEYIDYTL
jgi:radical SAM superfamily enzyme YgiQ (UPF0313 family)